MNVQSFAGIRNALCTVGAVLAAAVLFTAPAHAAEKVRFLTNWFAQAEHGGYYQAKATGLYEAAGLDVSISMGGPQVNVMQLLLAGEADIILGYDIQTLISVEKGLPVVNVAATFQKDPRCIMTRPDVESLGDLEGKTLLVASGGRTEWWPWLKAKYGYTDQMAQPYTFNLQPFFSNDDVAQQCYISSEPYQARQRDVDVNVFLLADIGYPPYGGPVVTTRDFLDNNREVVEKFVRASMQGWKDYLTNPGPANALIMEDNPKMTEDQIAFALKQFDRFGVVTGGDAQEMGIGVITEQRWKKTYEFLVEYGLVGKDVDWHKAFTTEIIDGIHVMPN